MTLKDCPPAQLSPAPSPNRFEREHEQGAGKSKNRQAKRRCAPVPVKNGIMLLTLLLTASISVVAEQPPSAGGAAESADELSSQATDPTASLMAFNFKFGYGDFHGPSDIRSGQWICNISFDSNGKEVVKFANVDQIPNHENKTTLLAAACVHSTAAAGDNGPATIL